MLLFSLEVFSTCANVGEDVFWKSLCSTCRPEYVGKFYLFLFNGQHFPGAPHASSFSCVNIFPLAIFHANTNTKTNDDVTSIRINGYFHVFRVFTSNAIFIFICNNHVEFSHINFIYGFSFSTSGLSFECNVEV